jgi:uncharacterized protein
MRIRPLIMVFAKAPVPSAVKTRLIPHIGAETACRLHRAFVKDTLAGLMTLEDRCDIEVHTDRLPEEWKPARAMKLQTSGDLGQRMLGALTNALAEGRMVAAILGSDSPTLPLEHVNAMLESSADVCLGPSSDGGFYAIACRRTAPAMFEGVEWSMPDTMERTLQSIRKTGLNAELGREWYDIDSSEDLARLIADPGMRPATRRALLAAGLIQTPD